MHNRSVGMIKIYLNFGLNRIMFLFFQANFLFLPVLGILLEKDIFHATQGTSTFSRTLRIESIRGNCQNRKSTQKIITKQRTQCLPLQNTGRYYAMRKLVTNCWANRIQSTGLTVQHKIYTDPNIHTGRSTRNTCHYRVFVLVAFFIGFLFVWIREKKPPDIRLYNIFTALSHAEFKFKIHFSISWPDLDHFWTFF